MKVVYVIYCNTPHHVYVGETEDLVRRLRQHRSGEGAKFTKEHGVRNWKLLEGVTEKQACVKIKQAHPDWIVCGYQWTAYPYCLGRSRC